MCSCSYTMCVSQARLTVIINTGLVNMMDLDHRVVPWDTVRSRAVLVSVLHQDEVTWTRDPSRDILLWPGHTATITAYPHLTNNKGTLPNMVDCRSEPFPYLGQQAYSRSGCRNTVMQMIAEKSVNCSLMSLPPSPGSDLPTCGPLEGLALMYILKVGSRAAMDYKGQICTSGTRRPRGPKSFNQE